MKPSTLATYQDLSQTDLERLQPHEALIFLHLMKTGGTSLFKLLKQHYPKELTFHYGSKPGRTLTDFHQLSAEKRDHLKFLHGHLTFGFHHRLNQPCRYVTMLREPVSRVVSLYYFLYQNPRRYLPDEQQCQTLREFLDLGCLDADNDQTRRIAGPISDQFKFGECTTELLDIAKQNLSQFLFVGITERFDESLIALRHSIGIDRVLYASFNKNSRKPKQTEIDASDLDVITAHSQLDIELYQYGNDLLDEAIQKIGDSFHTEYYFFSQANQQYRSAITQLGSVKKKIKRARKKLKQTRQRRQALKQNIHTIQNEMKGMVQSRFWRLWQRLMQLKPSKH
ncbi:MAG: sulfotransferase family 2 domain-containing protein [Cyanobacteria bacterium P01_A01_bin.37]